jgi:hypothetical protein
MGGRWLVLLLAVLGSFGEPPGGCDGDTPCSGGTSEEYEHERLGKIRFRRDGRQICIESMPSETAAGWMQLRCAHLDEGTKWHPEFTLYNDLIAPMLGAVLAPI